MLFYYIKLAWRNLVTRTFFSLFNILGLAIGLAACIAVWLFIRDEKSFDLHNKDADRIYRITSDVVNDDGSMTVLPVTAPALAITIQRQLPEVEKVVRLFPPSSAWGARFYVRTGNKKFYEQHIYRVDSSFFDIFTSSFIAGTAATALQDINSIVLTESIAKKYFGNENPVGKLLDIDDWKPHTVIAVIKDFPPASHFTIDILVSLKSLDEGSRLSNLWGWSSFYTYVKIKAGSSFPMFEEKIARIYRDHNKENKNQVSLQALTDIHLHSNLTGELRQNSSPVYSSIFSIVSLLILCCACINYVNLSTAQAAARSKEISMRKISGAGIASLLLQFLMEAMLSALMAAGIGLLIVWLLLPLMNAVTGKQLHILQNPVIIPGTLLLALVTGLIAGFYPALHLAMYKPIDGLKQKVKYGFGKDSIRKMLVIAQFTIAASVITGLIIVRQQLAYMQQQNTAFNRAQVIVVNDAGYLNRSTTNIIKNEWLQISGVENVTAADGVPGGYNWTRNVRNKNMRNTQLINFLSIDDDFIPAFNMQVIEGRNFSAAYPADTANRAILNETAVRQLGFKGPVTGQQFVWGENRNTCEITTATICGVVKDFYFSSMKEPIRPFAFIRRNDRRWVYAVKTSGKNISATIDALKHTWEKHVKSRPFQYSFLDATYARLYQSESNFTMVFSCLAVIAVAIACMGLFGLSLFTTRQRAKEITIRKILGASVHSIIHLLSKDFVRLAFIGSLVSFPISWWLGNQWLADYAYHIQPGWFVFVMADSLLIAVCIFTAGYHTIKAAIQNPASQLRTE